MKRRHLALGLLCAGTIVPASAVAQRKAVRLGILVSASRPAGAPYQSGGPYDHFFRALRQAGWVEGRNLSVDWRFAEGGLERMDPSAAELVALTPNLILATTQPAAVAVMKATKAIPIVFALVQDPLSSGLAVDLARPGKNATGLVSMNIEILSKRIDLLLKVVPSARRIALLHQPDFEMNVQQVEESERILQSLGLTALRVGIGRPQTFDASFDKLAQARSDGLVVIESPALFTHRADVVRRVSALRLPAIYGFQPFTLEGGLMSYSIDFADQFRRAAGYVDRILRGVKAGELPIEQPLRFDLTLNATAAKALGINLPKAVLLMADRVIE